MFKPFQFIKIVLLTSSLLIIPLSQSCKTMSSNNLKSDIENFNGFLEEGHVYEAIWPIEEQVFNNMPRHHALNMEWRNSSGFPQLKNNSRFIFKVISKKIYKVVDLLHWNDEYVCEILKLRDVDKNTNITFKDLEKIRMTLMQYYQNKKPDFWESFVEELRRGGISLDKDDIHIGIWNYETRNHRIAFIRQPPLSSEMYYFGVYLVKQQNDWKVEEAFYEKETLDLPK